MTNFAGNFYLIKALKVKKKASTRKKPVSAEVPVKKAAKKRAASRKKTPPGLVATIIRSIQDKKGEHIISIDLRKIPDSVCDFFIVCDAPSTTQVKAIADHVMNQTEEVSGEKPWHHEGTQHAEWVLLDYVDTVVHIFLTPQRRFYQLEELWSDGVIEEHNA